MGGDRERYKVEEGGYPAVEGGLLVAGLDVGLPLIHTPGLTRAEYRSAFIHQALTLTTTSLISTSVFIRGLTFPVRECPPPVPDSEDRRILQ